MMDAMVSTEEVILNLKQATFQFVHCAASDEADPCTISEVFIDEANLLDGLRHLRQLAFSMAASDNLNSPSSEDVLSLWKQVLDFFDSLLLVMFKGTHQTKHWLQCDTAIKSTSLSALSICIQCLANSFSYFRTAHVNPPQTYVESLISILLTGSRSKFLLAYIPKNPLYNTHNLHLQKLVSYYSFLLYTVLLNFRLSGLCIDQPRLDLLLDKVLLDSDVLTSLCRTTSHPDESSILSMTEHGRLLLSELATLFSSDTSLPNSLENRSTPLETVLTATGLVLSLRHYDHLTSSSQTTESNDVKKLTHQPRTVQPCLAFWRLISPSEQDQQSTDLLARMIRGLDEYFRKWYTDLKSVSSIQPMDPDASFAQMDFPYSNLRGLIHLLSGIFFVKSDEASQPGSCCLKSCSSLSQEQVHEAWDRICDVLVSSHLCTEFLQAQHVPEADGESSSLDRVIEGSSYSMRPSLLSKPQPIIGPTSPFSLAQQTGFKQDCIRCLVGLLSQFPQLALRLVSHRLEHSPFTSDNVPSKGTFEVLLECTNRDPHNPFASEWTLLLIKLALNPASSDQDVLEGARQLALRLDQLSPIPKSISL